MHGTLGLARGVPVVAVDPAEGLHLTLRLGIVGRPA